MTTKAAFYDVHVPDEALDFMCDVLGNVDVPGLQGWYRELDEENVRDLCASYQLWINSQTESKSLDLPTVPEPPEELVPPPPIPSEQCAPTNGRRLRVKFRAPRLRRSHA